MDWHDEGIILSVTPHGETSAIVELFTREHGRHLGLVRGGRSRRQRPVLQPGNAVEAQWRARLSEHLGAYKTELVEPFAALAMDDRIALAGLNTLTALARLLPERDPHAGLYEAGMIILRHITEADIWPGLLVCWELELLNELGFGLDLESCAGTGKTDDLIYVSPKSGRAVSRGAGEPYREKLLKLPDFLRNGQGNENTEPEWADILDGFTLTGFFLEKHVMAPRGIAIPEARERLLVALGNRLQA